MRFFTSKRVYFGLAATVFVYIVLRAILMPLYVDELYSYHHYVRTGFLSPFNDYRAANNHLLNTFFTTISYHLFGNSPFSLRLFNVLAFIPFAVYLYKIGSFFSHKITRWLFYFVMMCSLNLLSYFSLSRGYGLSFAFMLMSVYYTIMSFQKSNVKVLTLSILFMLLALYANFSLLLFVLISLGVLVVNVIKNRKYYLTKNHIVELSLLCFLVLISLGFALKVLFFLKGVGELWWGGLDGFWDVTVISLLEFLFRTKDGNFLFQGGIILLTVIMTVIYLAKDSCRKKYNSNNLFFIYLFLNVIGILMMANLFDVNYPFQRTGLHLYVFFLGAYCFAIDKIRIKWVRISLMLPFIYIPFHFLMNMNVSYVSCWEEDNLPDSFYENVKKIEAESYREYPISIYIEGTTVTCWEYKVENDGNVLPNTIIDREKTKEYYDYLIDRRENVAPFKELYDSLDYQESSEVCLYKRKEQVKRVLLKEVKDTSFKQINSEFYEFVRFEVDSMISNSLFFDIKANFEYLVYPFQTNVIFSIKNISTGELIGYKPIRLDMKKGWKREDVLKQADFISKLPVNEKLLIVVYVWNMKKVDYKLHSSELKIYNVVE